jgi:hypothetical protein
MAWVAPASKWKSQRKPLNGCGNDSTGGVGPAQCVIRERFDTLAKPRVFTVAGVESVCADHADPAEPVPVGQIELFTGEWLPFDEWHAYESTWYSWVVWHEIGERVERGEIDAVEAGRAQAKQAIRSARVARGASNLHRVDTDDGPWKPIDAITNPTAAERSAVTTVAGWAQADDRLVGQMRAEVTGENPDADPIWYWTGSGGSRVLHADTLGELTPPARSRVSSVIDLRFGAGRLVWDG